MFLEIVKAFTWMQLEIPLFRNGKLEVHKKKKKQIVYNVPCPRRNFELIKLNRVGL